MVQYWGNNVLFFALYRLVTKAWGYYLSGRNMLITSNGKEYSPRISFPTNSGSWYNLRSEVRGTQVKIYVNDKLAKKITMLGDGADAKSNNQVGIWCHSSIPVKGDSFKGNVKRNFLNEKYPDKLLLFNVLVISFLRIRFWLVPELPSGYDSGYNFKRKTPSCRTQWIKRAWGTWSFLCVFSIHTMGSTRYAKWAAVRLKINLRNLSPELGLSDSKSKANSVLLWKSQNREHQKYLWNVIVLREFRN